MMMSSIILTVSAGMGELVRGVVAVKGSME